MLNPSNCIWSRPAVQEGAVLIELARVVPHGNEIAFCCFSMELSESWCQTVGVGVWFVGEKVSSGGLLSGLKIAVNKDSFESVLYRHAF